MKGREVKVLAGLGTYQGRKLRGTLEETHISWVILTRQFAFKIKKPLKFSFLDFSSLARRKKFCEREVALNRRFSAIYLGVVPVRYSRGMWRLGFGKGPVVDYAVRMKRMRSDRRMTVLLRSKKVTASQVVALAKSVASFHDKAEVIGAPFDLAFARRVFNDIRVTRRFLSKTLPREFGEIARQSTGWSDDFLRGHRTRFRERAASGFTRDGHGDLHSGNIFLYKRPVIFDCIEFNDSYRQIDVLDEVAFFCMDLEYYGQTRLAAVFMEEYARRFPCFQKKEDHDIFNYYKCYRANVRAKVHSLAAAQETDPNLLAAHVSAVKKYLRLMSRYMKL